MSSAPDAPPTVRRRSTSVQMNSSILRTTRLEDIGGVDLVFDVIGGDVQEAVRGA